MKSRRLGKTGLKVSEIGFGGWAIGGAVFDSAYGATDDEISRAAIRRALELGVTFFDTADLYGHGHSEALLGEVMSEWPAGERIVIATKGGVNFYRLDGSLEKDLTPYAIANAVQHSRQRLRREKLDLYLLMNPPEEMLLDNDRVWETLVALQKAGQLGAVGVSVEEPQEGVRLLKAGAPVDVIEVVYNLFYQSAALELFPLAHKKRVGIIAREPLANGFLSGKYAADAEFPEGDMRRLLPPEYLAAMSETAQALRFLERSGRTLAQAALRFALDEPAVAVAIPGMKTPAQVEENVAAARLPELTEEERLAIHRVFFPEEHGA
ncbi:MAG TPA: aldo/keto reductase [Capsulimonadaceae bacterium]|nr:aldo/keto reductase [Capsulimonadaceae bacterium]